MENKDYVFQVNWEDRHKDAYVVGILAQIDKEFYLIFKDKEDIETAYKQGYIGIPGFNQEEIYKSHELFDFFKSRVLQSAQSNPCEELAKTKGVSMVDSFSVEPIPERMIPKYREIIIQTYELLKRKEELKKKESLEQNYKTENDSNESPNI